MLSSFLWSAWLVPEACAQRLNRRTPVDMSQDTTAARMVMASVFGQLGHEMARAAVDTTLRPWLVDLPRDGRVRWSRFRDHLFAAVRGRPPLHEHEARHVLSIEQIEMRGDTLVAAFTTGFGEFCGKDWMGDATGYEMRAIRRGDAFEMPTTRRTMHSHGWCHRPTLPPPSPIESGPIDSLFPNARIRVQSPRLPAGWTIGEFIRLVRAKECLIIAVEKPQPAEYPLSEVTRLQVSTRYFGRPATGPQNIYINGDTVGERWRDVDLPRLLARDRGCKGR